MSLRGSFAHSRSPFALALLVPALCAALAAPAAAEWQPVATATTPSADALVAALKVIGRSSGNANLDATVRSMIARGQRGELPGLDRERRGAIVVETDGLAVVPMALVPVTDGEALLQSLAALIGPSAKTAGGNFRVGNGEATGYVKLADGWAYVAQSESDFSRLPDPMIAAGGPPEEDFAVQLWPMRLPEAYRTMAIDYLDGKGAPGAAAGGNSAAGGLLRGFLAEAEHVRLVSRMQREKPIQHIEIELKPAARTRSYQRMISLSATGFRGAPLEGQVRLGATLALISLDLADPKTSSYLSAAGSFLAADDDAIKYELRASDGKFRLKLEMAEGIMRSAGTGITLLAVAVGQ